MNLHIASTRPTKKQHCADYERPTGFGVGDDDRELQWKGAKLERILDLFSEVREAVIFMTH